MGYFPFFIDIKGKKGLVIGGGRIAEHKISKLLAYEPELTVVARKVSDSIKSIEGGSQRRQGISARTGSFTHYGNTNTTNTTQCDIYLRTGING